jgi:hypothetical protein
VRKRRAKKLTPDSTHDVDWARSEYAQLMGEEKAHEQELAYRLENDLCTCPGFKPTTIKTRGSFRTIHKRDCSKWKPWMEEYENLPKRWPGLGERD